MEPTIDIQKLFFLHIKNNLAPHLSLVEEVSELLNVSNDSAYRRIRAEKPISFEELRTLCMHFKISLDKLFHLGTDSIIFSGKPVDGLEMTLEHYLKYVLDQLQFINSHHGTAIISLNKDIPIFHHFNFAELAAFKFFFWMKTILQHVPLTKKLYVADEHMETLLKTSSRIIEEYNKIPTQEVWNIECIHSTIRQIEYYKDSRVFASGQDIVALYDALQKTIDHIEAQVEQEFKFPVGAKQGFQQAAYKMYVNEFILGDNTYVAVLNHTPQIVYLNHSVLNIITTRDDYFTGHTYHHYQNIVKKSTLISGAGERERLKFFSTMREKIENRKKAIGNY